MYLQPNFQHNSWKTKNVIDKYMYFILNVKDTLHLHSCAYEFHWAVFVYIIH